MNKRTRKHGKKQTQELPKGVVIRVGQLLLPMVGGIAATKQGLTEWVYETGLEALHSLLREDAEEVAGPKGKHRQERTH